MGYHVDFYGELSIAPSLTYRQVIRINEQQLDEDLLTRQPASHSHWVVDDTRLSADNHDGSNYYWLEWLELIIEQLARWDCEINGEIEYHGDDPDDVGVIVVLHNQTEDVGLAMAYEEAKNAEVQAAKHRLSNRLSTIQEQA